MPPDLRYTLRCKEYLVSLEDPDLAYFTEGTSEFDAYIKDMLWSQRYAYESRARMNRQLLRSLAQVVRPSDPDSERAMTVRVINCHHNYTEREHHQGRDLWITRKGAIKAGAGDLGVIPGSRAAMKGKTWNASAAARALVDEDPRAYKDIRKVMADQADLTAVVHVLRQVLNYKGTSG